MWVYDGEEWTKEGGETQSPAKPEHPQRFDEFVPELQIQIVEIVPTPQKRRIPPLPFP
jgi:hypothetical protein